MFGNEGVSAVPMDSRECRIDYEKMIADAKARRVELNKASEGITALIKIEKPSVNLTGALPRFSLYELDGIVAAEMRTLDRSISRMIVEQEKRQ